MKRRLLIWTLIGALSLPASANPYLLLLPFAMMGAQVASTLGPPLTAMTGYGICHTPSIHICGTDNTTVGLDLSSYGAKSVDVYGLQLSICGGGFMGDLYGIEMSPLACGWVNDYDTSWCRMNGIEIAPFAVKTAMANGFQLCPIYSTASIVNGFQVGGIYANAGFVRGLQIGLVNGADRVEGIQVGLYNLTRRGNCLQLGLINCIQRRGLPVLPILNLGFR